MTRKNKKIAILYILFLSLSTMVKGQILEFYEPIIVTYKSGLLNNDKISIGVFDYFKQDTSKMKSEYLKYDSDKESLYKYDSASKNFQKIICLKSEISISHENIKLGIFDELRPFHNYDLPFLPSLF